MKRNLKAAVLLLFIALGVSASWADTFGTPMAPGYVPTDEDAVTFVVGGKPIMLININGIIYHGKIIYDAGEAHKAFIEVMRLMRDQEASEVCNRERPK